VRDVRVDARERVSLTFRTHKHDRYLYEEDPDGTIHLYPAVLVPARVKEPLREGHDVLAKGRDVMEILREHFPMAEEIS
jgi:hypothetical protein